MRLLRTNLLHHARADLLLILTQLSHHVNPIQELTILLIYHFKSLLHFTVPFRDLVQFLLL